MFSLSAPDLCIYNENSLNSPFVRAGQPDRSVRKTGCTNLKDEFYSSPLSFFEKKKKKKKRVQVSEWLFFNVLQHNPIKMTHSLYRLAGLDGQLWQMESTLSYVTLP